MHFYRLDPATGEHQAFTRDGIDFMEFHVLPDGRSVAAIHSDEEHCRTELPTLHSMVEGALAGPVISHRLPVDRWPLPVPGQEAE